MKTAHKYHWSLLTLAASIVFAGDAFASSQETQITVDATALSAAGFNIDYNPADRASYANEATSVNMTVGAHTFCAPAPANCFPFRVTAAGAVDFDASLDAYVSGRGTTTLVVTGFAVTIDATALTVASTSVNYGYIGAADPRQPVTFQMIPGAYTFCAEAFVSCFSFSVTEQGTVDTAPELDSFVAGQGTSTLTISGFAVTIDAREVFADSAGINDGDLVIDYPDQVVTLQLIPGVYTFYSPASADRISFSVTEKGTVDTASELDGFVSGQGTSTLTVTSFPATEPDRR